MLDGLASSIQHDCFFLSLKNPKWRTLEEQSPLSSFQKGVQFHLFLLIQKEGEEEEKEGKEEEEQKEEVEPRRNKGKAKKNDKLLYYKKIKKSAENRKDRRE